MISLLVKALNARAHASTKYMLLSFSPVMHGSIALLSSMTPKARAAKMRKLLLLDCSMAIS